MIRTASLRRTLWVAAAAIAMAAVSSCEKDKFDKEVWDGMVNYTFMVDQVDKDHEWLLTKNDTITVQVTGDIYSVQILTANPYSSTKAEIAAEGVCFGNQAKLTYTMPVTQNTVWVAALDTDGNYMGVKSTVYGTKELELSRSQLSGRGTPTQPTYQTFTYIYESGFPVPDDFDYNDMVLRISKSTPNIANSNEIDLTVTLLAAGTQEQIGAAIQLADINYSDLSKVEIVKGESMCKNYPLMYRMLPNDKVLFQARNGNAVISLFEDAHWAFRHERDDLGRVLALRYNTDRLESENESAKADPVTVVYRLYFKDREKARLLTFDRIDPFLVHDYNTGLYEVHTYAHKFDETLRKLYSDISAFDNHISWAMIIPKSDFRYPLEGISLCKYNEETGEWFGPYDGFARWMQNSDTHQDWYQTLNLQQLVY